MPYGVRPPEKQTPREEGKGGTGGEESQGQFFGTARRLLRVATKQKKKRKKKHTPKIIYPQGAELKNHEDKKKRP